MELESELGYKIPIQFDSDTQIGRLSGLEFSLSSTDRSVSRRHLLLRLVNDPVEGFQVGFEVIGKNPIWVCAGDGGGGRMFKRLEKGELRAGEKFSLSVKKPSFFVVKRREEEIEPDGEERTRVLNAVERREKRTLERRREKEEKAKEEAFECKDDERIESVDISKIDPVKEFGFLVKGYEFDQYSKKKMRGIKNWNWFLEETSNVADDDNYDDDYDGRIVEPSSCRGEKSKGMKKKRQDGDGDEEWTGDSDEEENAAVVKGGGVEQTRYSTRSKHSKRPRIDTSKKDAKSREVEDEEDENLGGFIVDEDEVEEEEEEAEDEESEEEFNDEEDLE